MEYTLALIVASSRALLGASPPAASAAGSRWGEGNGRMAAADGIYIGGEGCGTLVGVIRWRRGRRGLGPYALTWGTGLGVHQLCFCSAT
jgi:hypothetical protein